MINYRFPKSFPRAKELKVYVNGEETDVLQTNVGYFVTVAYEGEAILEIEAADAIRGISISPFRLNLKAEIDHNKAVIRLDRALYLYLIIDGVGRPLYFYGNKTTSYDPAEATYYFKSSQIYEIGELQMKDNEAVYIEGGAIVSGSIHAENSSNIKIYGHGVLDGSYFANTNQKTIFMDRCTGVEIKDITIIQPPQWMILIAGCNGVRISNVKEIGEVVCSDGADLVGSSNVLVENCMFRNKDDSIAIKAFEDASVVTGGGEGNGSADENGNTDGRGGVDGNRNTEGNGLTDGNRYNGRNRDTGGWNKEIDNIEIRHCTFINGGAGNAVEIGHELQIEEVKNIRFIDIDIVCVDSFGAALAIHAGDRATVRDITYEDIRIQHYYDKLIDFRVMRSMFNRDEERGHIRNIRLKNIRVTESIYNPGYSISVIGGYDGEHLVEDVVFEDFYLNDRKVLNADQLDLHTKNVRNIIFR